MTRAPQPALIWDLDGTLVDSYQMIVPSLQQFYAEHGVHCDAQTVRRAVLGSSVRDFAAQMLARTGVSLEAGMARYTEIRNERELALQPMPGARAVLDRLTALGVPSCLLTHRGASTQAVLARTGLDGAFAEVLTAQSSFPRKPAPDALCYLMRRHGFDPAQTFYVGDRQMDVDCAHNAGLRAIFLRTPDGPEPKLGLQDAEIPSLDALLRLPLFRALQHDNEY